MTSFLVAAALVMAASLAVLSRPWWKGRGNDTDTRRAINAAIYRDQLAELEKDRAGGELGEADFLEAQAELKRRLLEDTAGDGGTGAAVGGAPASSRRTLALLLVFLPLTAAGLYWALGNPTALDPMARRDFSRQDIDDMVASLAAKLEKEPENYQGWLMLARSYKALGRYDEAERAFEKAMPVVEKNAQLLGAYADLLAAKAGGSLEGKPEELIGRALALDPDDLQALWLAGTVAFNRKDFATALRHWQHALELLPPESEDAKMLTGIVAEARDKLEKKKSAAATAIGVRVEIANVLRDKVAPGDTVFVLARTKDSPMPLAVRRLAAADLPKELTLDDTDALPGGGTLSEAKTVVIEARVSKSGDARPRPGDLVGSLATVKPGARNLKLAIDRVVE